MSSSSSSISFCSEEHSRANILLAKVLFSADFLESQRLLAGVAAACRAAGFVQTEHEALAYRFLGLFYYYSKATVVGVASGGGEVRRCKDRGESPSPSQQMFRRRVTLSQGDCVDALAGIQQLLRFSRRYCYTYVEMIIAKCWAAE